MPLDHNVDKTLEFQNCKVKPCATFEEMGLKEDLLRGLTTYGYTAPSAIQQRGIVPFINGRDIIAQSQTGTGKTSMFCLGCLHTVDTRLNATQCLILSPTRELALQTQSVCMSLATYMQVSVHASVGGHSLAEDIRRLDNGVQIVSATPGRCYDMIKRGHFQTKELKVMVLDEADEMLKKGFRSQIYDIYRHLPQGVQCVLLSLTMPQDVLEMTKNFMADPVTILVKRDELSLEGIKQYFIDTEKEEYKLDTLLDLHDMLTITQSVIFRNRKDKVIELGHQLLKQNFDVVMIHGDMPQAERDEVTKKFRAGEARLLLATDIFGRGIDVQQVSLVINYDIPNGPDGREQYLHRIGRSGRYGRKGIAINFVTKEDISLLRDIEQFYSTQIDEMPVNLQDTM